MKAIRVLAALLALSFAPAIAHAQRVEAQTVSACGTPNNTPVTGLNYPITQDPTGKLCTASAASISGSTSNATSGQATNSNNLPAVSYNYGFNGTTWDQLQVDGAKSLKINCITGCSGSGGSGGTGGLQNPFRAQGSQVQIAATTTTAQVAIGTAATTVLVANPSSTSFAYVNLGTTAGVTASTTTSIPIPPGGQIALTQGANTNIAAIMASGTATIQITPGITVEDNISTSVASSIPAGTNNIGSVVPAVPAAGAGTNTVLCSLQIKATATACGSSAAHNITGFTLDNTGNSAASQVQVFNLATGSVTLGTTVPLANFSVPANGTSNLAFVQPIGMSTAVTVACTTAAGGSGAPTSNCGIVFFGN